MLKKKRRLCVINKNLIINYRTNINTNTRIKNKKLKVKSNNLKNSVAI